MAGYWKYWERATWEAVVTAPKSLGISWRTVIVGVLSLIVGLGFLALQKPEDVGNEWFINANTVIYPLFAFLLLAFVVSLARYPKDREDKAQNLYEQRLESLMQTKDDEIASLTTKVTALEKAQDVRRRRQEQADMLAAHRKEIQEILLQWNGHADHSEKKGEADRWFIRCAEEIERDISFAERDLFESALTQPPPTLSQQWEFDRHFFVCKLNKLRAMIGDINVRLR